VPVDTTDTPFANIGGWSGNYQTYNDTVCINDTMQATALSSCVDSLTFAVVTSLTYDYN